MNFEQDFDKNCSERCRIILGLNEIDPIQFSKSYFDSRSVSETSIDPNANIGGISPNNYMIELAKPSAKKYFFKRLYEEGVKLFGEQFSLKHVYEGTIYIHDATKLQPYCFGLSATEVATEGRPYSSLPALPPKRFESFMGQMTEYIMDCSQEFAGAIAITDLVPWMAWFVEKDNKYSDKDIENIFQSFIHVLNNDFRIGGDAPFTNISINSKMVYNDIFEHYIFPDGKKVDDLWKTIKRVQKIIIDFMERGRPDGLPYRFPILTANFKSDKKEMDSQWFAYVAKKNANGFMNVNFAERFSMCCRLQLDFSFKQNSFGGGGVKVGSMRVANLNLPRIAYIARENISKMTSLEEDSVAWKKKVEVEYDVLIRYYTDIAIQYLAAYHEIFKDLVDRGFLKFFREPHQWFSINMFFATVGFCGIYDAAELIDTDRIVDIMERTVNTLVYKTKGKSNGMKFNVEEVPSESAAGTMTKFNRDFGEKKQYYSNQFLPLSLDIPLPQRIAIESKLQSKLTGGGMTFLNFDAKLTQEQSLEIHKYMMNLGFTGQFCINYGFSYCPKCKAMMIGKHNKVCACGTQADFYTRVVGYLAKVKNTCTSKALEIGERYNYKLTTLS